MSNMTAITREMWLRRLEWALHALPTKDRDEIVRETCSHIEERIAQGVGEPQILASLGMRMTTRKVFWTSSSCRRHSAAETCLQ